MAYSVLLNNAQEDCCCCKELHWAIHTPPDLKSRVAWPWDPAEHGLKT